MFIRHFVKSKGLRAYWHVETVAKAHCNFAKIGRQSEGIELDKILLRNRLEQELSSGNLLSIIVFDEMRRVVERIDRVSRDIIWNGDANNSYGDYQECDGILKQIDGVASEIDLADDDSVKQKMEECKYNSSVTWCIAGRIVPKKWMKMLYVSNCPVPIKNLDSNLQISSDLYILPLARTPGRDNGIYAQRVDYRSGLTTPDDAYFWTDDGEFLWTPQQEWWDFDITCQTEFRVIVPRPELVTVIKDVPVVYTPYEEV